MIWLLGCLVCTGTQLAGSGGAQVVQACPGLWLLQSKGGQTFVMHLCKSWESNKSLLAGAHRGHEGSYQMPCQGDQDLWQGELLLPQLPFGLVCLGHFTFETGLFFEEVC